MNFYGNNEYNDGFTYENRGGYNLLAKLNQHNPAVRDYICNVIRFWVKEFDIDGIRVKAVLSEEVKEPEKVVEQTPHAEAKKEATPTQNKSYEEMTIEEFQKAILERMRRNGPVTDQMRKDVMENVYHNSLVTWIKSFH